MQCSNFREERRRWLREHYNFYCACAACEGNLPVLFDSPAASAAATHDLNLGGEVTKHLKQLEDITADFGVRSDEGEEEEALRSFQRTLDGLWKLLTAGTAVGRTADGGGCSDELRRLLVKWTEAHGRMIKFVRGNKKIAKE